MKLLVLFSLIPWFIGELYAHNQKVDYHTIKEHLIKTYSRNKLSEYSERDYIVTADNFLIDPQLKILARQAYRDNEQAIQTLQELRTEFQIKLHSAKKQADISVDKYIKISDNAFRMMLGFATGASFLMYSDCLNNEAKLVYVCISATVTIAGSLIGLSLPSFNSLLNPSGEKDLYIATVSLMRYIREIEKLQRHCLLKKEKNT
jgi:hypothetical protein